MRNPLAARAIAFALPLLLSPPAFAEPPAVVTPYSGQPRNWECRQVRLEPSNVVGFLAVPVDEQTVSARVLYKSGARSTSGIRLRLMKEDSQALGAEIEAMLRGVRTKAILFEARASGQGCEFTRVVG